MEAGQSCESGWSDWAENRNCCDVGRPAHEAGQSVQSDQTVAPPVPQNSVTISPLTILDLEPLMQSVEMEPALPKIECYYTDHIIYYTRHIIYYTKNHTKSYLHVTRSHSLTVISFSMPQWAAVNSISSQSACWALVLNKKVIMSHFEIAVLKWPWVTSLGHLKSYSAQSNTRKHPNYDLQ